MWYLIFIYFNFQGFMANNRTTQTHYTDTIIGSDSMFDGVLNSDGNIRIDGLFDGEIISTLNLHVSDVGRVRARIHTATCTITGSVMGNIQATNDVVIESSARVWGEIESPTLQIEPGAVFKGKSNGKSDNDALF
ncbi:MAG: hypothetical protein RI985_1436 [Chloroflexota bacterium]